MNEHLEIDHTIQTYVRRSSRMTKFQKTSYQNLYALWATDYTKMKDIDTKSVISKDNKFSFANLFGNNNPVICEIGFGSGNATAIIAKENPNKNYLCIEVFKAGIANLLGLINEMNISNIKIIEGDAIKILEESIPDFSISAFHFFFPDPWQKKRHNKRRFMLRPRTNLLQQKLSSFGYIYMVTDWTSYAIEAHSELSKTTNLKSVYELFAPTQVWRPKTKFEAKAIKEGRQIYELMFRKTN